MAGYQTIPSIRDMAGEAFDVDECRIAVLVPCHNEELAIAQVVHDFRTALPGAVI